MKSTLLDAIEYIEEYSFSFLKNRFINSMEVIDEYSFKLVEETLKDYYLSCFLRRQSYCPEHLKTVKSLMPPNKIIDELWHLHIIHTKEYFKFSNELFGSYFHHNPTSEEERVNVCLTMEMNNLYLFGNYIKDYRKYSLEDLNKYKLHKHFSLLSQSADYLNEIEYEEVLENLENFKSIR